MATTFDTIILGAGAMGSAAAYYLSKQGHRVLLLEQFEIDHRKGSSYGYSRIIRYSYDHPAYIALARAAFPAWHAIQEESQETLYVRTGGIDFGPPDDLQFRNTVQSVQNAGIPHEMLDPQEAQRRFPQFRLNSDWQVLHQPDSGLLAASRCVKTHLRLAEQHGAVIRANSPVTVISASARSVAVTAGGEKYSAGGLVVAAGSWSKQVLGWLGLDLPLTPLRAQLAFFRPQNIAAFATGRFPVFIAHVESLYGRVVYGVADYEGSGMKIAFHGGEVVNNLAEVNYTPDDGVVDALRAFNRKHIPSADAPLLSSRICLYTMTPDEHFIIDRHPEYPHIALGCGFSGHGFKFSTLIGSILCELVTQGHTPHDISLFSSARFTA